MADLSSSSSSARGGSSPSLPTRRRLLGGPLHPVNRAPPAALASAGMSSEDTVAAPSTSVFVAPTYSRKRNHYATSTVSPSIANPTYSTVSMHGHIGLSQHFNSTPTDYHQSPPHFTDSSSNSLRAPHGEFSFQSQAFTHEENMETSSIAFAKLAQAQRAQQESQRQIASGFRADEHTDGPATKKRKGVAGILVDSALSAVIYTGAAAVTAYSVWSSWSSKGPDHSRSNDGTSSKGEKLPSGGMEEPPPPYIDHCNASRPSAKTPLSPPRPSHVFVSSRRRRPAFQSHKSLRAITPKSTTSQPSQPTQTPVLEPIPASSVPDDEDMDGDDTFARLQLQMASLIEEGNRALQSKALLDEEDRPSTTESTQTAPWSPARPSNLPVSPPRSSSNRGSQAWPYSRIPRLGATSSPHTKSRY